MTTPQREAWVVVVPAMWQSEKHTAELLGEATRLVGAGAVRALAVGSEVRGELEALSRWGLTSGLLVEHPVLADYHPERFARVIADAVRGADPHVLLFAGTVLGADLGARVAGELGRRFHGGCVNFDLTPDGVRVTRPVCGGRWHQLEVAGGAPLLLSLVPDTVGPGAASRQAALHVEVLDVEVRDDPTALEDLGFTAADPRTVDLVDADVIVAGGRGVGGLDGFDLLAEIADELGGSLAASRPAVEAGWAPYERQVGQTGRVVRPRLYLACGISGATQHLAGMREAETIIAINNDPTAPILGVATLGVEGDLHQVLPALAECLRARTSGLTP